MESTLSGSWTDTIGGEPVAISATDCGHGMIRVRADEHTLIIDTPRTAITRLAAWLAATDRAGGQTDGDGRPIIAW
jgi:hypothetical protein